MGKIINNAITSSFSGKFGDDIVFKRSKNKTFFARKGENKTPASAEQVNNRQRFAEVQLYIRQLLENPDQLELYAIMAELNEYYSALTAAVKDYMCLPEIDTISLKKYKGQSGDAIHIKPKIRFKIVRMTVTLYHPNGTILESGAARKAELNWKYFTTVENTNLTGTSLEIIAHDRFDKSTTFTQRLG
jgi:hypothetical protein